MPYIMKASELKHLRQLLGWVSCEIGQTPMEMTRTILAVGSKLGNQSISDEAKGRLVDDYKHAESVPKYVRAAVNSLTKVMREADTRSTGTVVDGLKTSHPTHPRHKLT